MNNILSALQVGFWIVSKYRMQAKAHGVQHAARNMRKQGFPIELAVAVLAGSS